MSPLGVTARNRRSRGSSSFQARRGPEPGQNRIPEPPQIHPRSTPDPSQIHPRSRSRSRSNTQLIVYFAIRVLLWGNFFFQNHKFCCFKTTKFVVLNLQNFVAYFSDIRSSTVYPVYCPLYILLDTLYNLFCTLYIFLLEYTGSNRNNSSQS